MGSKFSSWILVIFSLLGLSISINYEETIDPVFIQDTTETIFCLKKNVSDPYGLVYSHVGVETDPYGQDVEYLLTINTTPGKRINLRFEYFDMERNFDIPSNRCRDTGDKLEIFESSDIFSIENNGLLAERTLCGGSGLFPEDYQSVGSVITVRLATDSRQTENYGVKFLYSSFTPPGEESSSCFLCHDKGMCIDKSLRCDGVPNCNDDSDEADDVCTGIENWFMDIYDDLGGTMVAVIGSALILLVILVLALCILACCCCCCKKSSDGHEQKQYRAPPVPQPTSYQPHASSPPSNYSSYTAPMASQHRPNLHYPPGYPTVQNGGYSVAYNHENGRMHFPHQV